MEYSKLTEKLLEIKNLTLVEALDKSRQRETATAQAESMSASSVGVPGSVYRVCKGLYMHQQPSIAAESQAPPVYVLSSKQAIKMNRADTKLNPRKAAEFRLPRTAKRCHLTPMHFTHINYTLFCSLENMIGLVNRTYLSCVCWDSLLELLQ